MKFSKAFGLSLLFGMAQIHQATAAVGDGVVVYNSGCKSFNADG